MSANPQDTQSPEAQKQLDKEMNFRKQEELFKRQIEQERSARLQAEERATQAERAAQQRTNASNDEDDDDTSDEPYVDHRRLKKALVKVQKQTKTETQSEIQHAVQAALADERKSNWLRSNSDFNEVMQHAQTFYDKDPELGDSILAMPEGFERQKLVYKNIKALGLHKKEEPKTNIQDKIEQNRRTPYYQPSSVGTAPYAPVGDFSQAGMKNSYSKMQELKARIGRN